jgi:regulatory protein
MGVVTDIKHQKRVGSNRYNVSIDGKYAFTMGDLDLSASGLRTGQNLTQSEIEDFSKGASEAKAYALALRYIGVRLRSRRELSDYLVKKGCDSEQITTALDRLEGLGLVDDTQFARAWTADRMAVRPRSRLRLGQELAAKGVSREVADSVLSELEPDAELATLVALIERKQRIGRYSDRQKLTDYLQRQGYRWDFIKSAMEVVDAN